MQDAFRVACMFGPASNVDAWCRRFVPPEGLDLEQRNPLTGQTVLNVAVSFGQGKGATIAHLLNAGVRPPSSDPAAREFRVPPDLIVLSAVDCRPTRAPLADFGDSVLHVAVANVDAEVESIAKLLETRALHDLNLPVRPRTLFYSFLYAIGRVADRFVVAPPLRWRASSPGAAAPHPSTTPQWCAMCLSTSSFAGTAPIQARATTWV
eukprot:63579-Prymnesium_polylepis.2